MLSSALLALWCLCCLAAGVALFRILSESLAFYHLWRIRRVPPASYAYNVEKKYACVVWTVLQVNTVVFWVISAALIALCLRGGFDADLVNWYLSAFFIQAGALVGMGGSVGSVVDHEERRLMALPGGTVAVDADTGKDFLLNWGMKDDVTEKATRGYRWSLLLTAPGLSVLPVWVALSLSR